MQFINSAIEAFGLNKLTDAFKAAQEAIENRQKAIAILKDIQARLPSLEERIVRTCLDNRAEDVQSYTEELRQAVYDENSAYLSLRVSYPTFRQQMDALCKAIQETRKQVDALHSPIQNVPRLSSAIPTSNFNEDLAKNNVVVASQLVDNYNEAMPPSHSHKYAISDRSGYEKLKPMTA